MAVAKQRPDPERLPREGQPALVVDRRALEMSARHLQLSVIEEHLALTGVEQPAGVGLLPHPRHKLMQQPPQRRDAFLGLFAQLRADLGWIGTLTHPEEFVRQRIVVERLAVGEATAAWARGAHPLADNDLGSVAPPLVLAGIEAEEPTQLVPQVEAPG